MAMAFRRVSWSRRLNMMIASVPHKRTNVRVVTAASTGELRVRSGDLRCDSSCLGFAVRQL